MHNFQQFWLKMILINTIYQKTSLFLSIDDNTVYQNGYLLKRVKFSHMTKRKSNKNLNPVLIIVSLVLIWL